MSRQAGYTVLIKRSAEREMNRLSASTFERLAQAILVSETEPRPRGSRKLRGLEEYRLRVSGFIHWTRAVDGPRCKDCK